MSDVTQNKETRFYSHAWVQYLFCLIFALLLLGITPKTPDSGWMGVYPVPVFPPLDTGIPVLRFLIPLEQFEYTTTGNLFITQNVFYALCYSIILFIFVRDALRTKSLLRLIFLLTPVFIGLFFAAVGGPLYDAVFALGLVLSLKLVSEADRYSPIQKILGVGVSLALLDLSRPNGIFFAVVLLLVLVFKSKTRSLWALIPLAVIALPWHLVQLMKYGTFTLTTYQGQNYAEAFQWQGIFSQSRDCLTELGRSLIDSQAFQSCSEFNQKFIIDTLIHNPTSIKYVLQPEHINSIIFPDPFWHATRDLQGNELFTFIATWVVRIGLVLLIGYWISQFQLTQNYLLGSAVFIIGMSMGVIAHNGTESIRLAMPFYMALIWGLTTTQIKIFTPWRLRIKVNSPNSASAQ